MFLTIGICTWNRAKYLNIALDAIKNLNIPNGIEWEILVVNNNCTDKTDDIIEKHAKNLPVRRLFEPRAGKSYALNHAVREARGEYILWTDDDAIVDKDWVKAYFEAFRKWPDAVFFGGPVKPWFDCEPPKWLNEETMSIVASAFAILEFKEGLRELTHEKLPYGVNMAIRYKEQSTFLYNTNYGPRPNSELRGEETLLMQKLLDNGYEGRWVPEALVRHYIPPKRMKIKFLRNYYRTHGALTWKEIKKGSMTNRFGTLRKMIVTTIHYELRCQYRRFLGHHSYWIRNLKSSSMAWGRLKGRLTTRLYFKD